MPLVRAKDGRYYDPSDEADQLAAANSPPPFRVGSVQGPARLGPQQHQAGVAAATVPNTVKAVKTVVPAVTERVARSGQVTVKPATVVGEGTPEETQVRLDGDSTTKTVPSLLGSLRPGDRVMVELVPPQGGYIIGWAVFPGRLDSTPWTDVVFQGGWSHYQPGTYQRVEWRRVADRIYLHGVGTRAAGPVARPVTVATIPGPARPATNVLWADKGSITVYGRGVVDAGGNITLEGGGIGDFFAVNADWPAVI